MRTPIATLLLALAAAGPVHLIPSDASAQPQLTEYRGSAAFGLALRRLGVAKRVLMVGAHPDDEDTQLLARWALVEGADAAYLSLTRGEGGQNGIGPELHEALGLIRTEELLAARRVDGARQFFTRAYDFGYSKHAEETFAHWPREALVRDVTEVIRRFRPDVVVAVFSGTPRDGHGHHQVSAIVAREAFDAAGDAERFPDQLAAGLHPHRPAKLYRGLRSNPEGATVAVPVGELDPLLGRSAFQLAMASRSRHRSQDMGRPEPGGPRNAYLLRILPAPAAPERSLWEGVDTTLTMTGTPGTRGASAAPIVAEYRASAELLRAGTALLNPGDAVPELARMAGWLERALAADGGDGAPYPVRFAMARELEAVREALTLASGLGVDALAETPRVSPGESFAVTLSVWNGGEYPVRVRTLEPALPAGWGADAVEPLPAAPLAPGTEATRRFRVRVPLDALPTEANFLRLERDGALYRVPDGPPGASAPFEAPEVRARAVVEVAGAVLPLVREAEFRDVDLRLGEVRRPVLVVPAVSVLVHPAVRVMPTGGGVRTIQARLVSGSAGPLAGTLHVVVPPGWRAEPDAVPVRFSGRGDAHDVQVWVHAPADVSAGDREVAVHFRAEDGRVFARGVRMIDYPHVRERPLHRPAVVRFRAFDVQVPAGRRVGYVEGAGEEGPGFLANLGIVPEVLGPEALASGDLDRLDVIVVGSRAYEVRPDLAAHNARLLEWVRRGGTLIVQYNKYELVQGGFTPYPLTMARPHGRVTDEAAPVRLLAPEHGALASPNRITAADFEGWVQERGLYFAETWDGAYTPLLETGDPGEAPLRGGLLVARYGEGTYVYTGLSFFRQFPEGVPGAYRLFANLLAL